MNVGDIGLQAQTTCLKRRGQGHDEAALEVRIEALHLSLSLGAIWPAQPRREAACLGQLGQLVVPAMPPRTVRVTLDDDRLGIVKQHVLRDATEIVERFAQPGAQRRRILGGSELDVGRTAIPLYPIVATSAISGSRPRPTWVKSACICWPGGVSNRTSGSGSVRLCGASHAFNWLMPPS